MPPQIVGLENIDGVLLDGLEFCSRVYVALDEVVAERGGQQEINLRTTARSKRLVEELLPLTQYVQARYGLGYRIRLRWWSSQDFVETAASRHGPPRTAQG